MGLKYLNFFKGVRIGIERKKPNCFEMIEFLCNRAEQKCHRRSNISFIFFKKKVEWTEYVKNQNK